MSEWESESLVVGGPNDVANAGQLPVTKRSLSYYYYSPNQAWNTSAARHPPAPRYLAAVEKFNTPDNARNTPNGILRTVVRPGW